MKSFALVALALAGCGDDLSYRFGEVVQVSGTSPLGRDCNGASQTGTNIANSEAEPSIAVDPTNAKHFVAMWQQDRWTNGGSDGLVSATSFDGGLTWTKTIPKFSRCSGGDAQNGGGYDRASDPWVAIGPDGAVYAMGLAFDNSTNRSSMLAARSTDGGLTWSDPATLIADDDADVFNDKNSVTADPTMPGRAYATWDRLTGQTMPTKPIGTGPTMLAIFHDGVWDAAKPIYDPGIDEQTIGNIIVVTPSGALVDVFERIAMASSQQPVSDLAAIRSIDHGATWSAPVSLGNLTDLGVEDPGKATYIRSGELPAAAADPASEDVYVVSELELGDHDGVALWSSSDGGQTWSVPRQVNQVTTAKAFTPAVAVGEDGTVGVSYYDTRDDEPGDQGDFDIAAFLVTSHDHAATWSEERLTGAFDLRPALVGQVYFLGDYEGLAASGSSMVPFFCAAFVAGDPSDMFVRPLP
jgi:Neuraminidase (sialidase)